MAPRHYHFARKHTWFVIQIIRYFVDRKVSKALPVECEESLVAFPFDARARFRTLLRLLGFQLSLMLIGRRDDENHVSSHGLSMCSATQKYPQRIPAHSWKEPL